MLRHDLVERLALALHEQRQGHAPFVPDRGLATRLGVGEGTLGRILRAIGFVPVGSDPAQWRWRGLRDRGNGHHQPRHPRAGGGLAEILTQSGPRLSGGDGRQDR
jgi:ATP-dependent RNA helicase SUPV3L1/SUV3